MALIDPIINRTHHSLTSNTFCQARDSLEQFEIDDFIGEGCSAKVYRVHYKSDCRKAPYALKVLNTKKFICNKQQQHLDSEIDILKQVRHPFVITMIDTFRKSNYQCMLFEYISGGDLHDRITQNQKLDLVDARFYLAQILLALQYLHSQDIVYRDLKPENVLVDKQGFVKLADFGFSKILKNNSRTYTMCGTPEYLSPEFLSKKTEGYGRSVDWWAFGVLTYELLVGETPFLANTPFEIYKKIIKGTMTYPKHVDAASKDLINGLLNSNLENRLGCCKGVELRNHPFFENICFQELAKRNVKPPASSSRSNPNINRECSLNSEIALLRFSEIEVKLGFFDCFCL